MRFESCIRLFNVTAVELGAVLWALTFGGKPDKYRHMIGRAKSFGAGQVRVAAAKLCVEPNVTASPLIKTAAGEKWDQVAPCENAENKPFLDAFEKHMRAHVAGWRELKTITEFLKASDPTVGAALALRAHVAGWRESKTITEFLKASDPTVGAALAEKGKIAYLPLRLEIDGRPRNPYQLLRDMTKPRKDGRPPIGPERFLEFD